MIPVIAIVGRPNVGKSTLFNALAGRRISIVEPTSGVTRDRVSAILTSPDGVEFELVDTGGMGGADVRELVADVDSQIRRAIADASVLLFVVDATAGVLPQDREIAARLRSQGRPIIVVASKVESPHTAQVAAEFHELGLGEPILVSALHRVGTGELRECLFQLVAPLPGDRAQPAEMRIAVVGSRNVGKSTFINALAHEERMIVSEIAGTTRDSVDVRFEIDGKVFIAIDTAGLRKRRQMRSSIEFYSLVRAKESVRRADVVLFLFDARSRVSGVDKDLGRYIASQFKPCILVVNKWDLARDIPTAEYVDYLAAELPGLGYAPISFVSALKNVRVRRTVELARSLWKQARTRVPTGRLNAAIEELKKESLHGSGTAKAPKIYYATQTGVAPPTFLLFVNSPDQFGPATRRFISRFLMQRLPFPEVPVVVRYREATGRK